MLADAEVRKGDQHQGKHNNPDSPVFQAGSWMRERPHALVKSTVRKHAVEQCGKNAHFSSIIGLRTVARPRRLAAYRLDRTLNLAVLLHIVGDVRIVGSERDRPLQHAFR